MQIITKIVRERREYNNWVANETLEDYSLRYAPRSFRKWSALLLANTALGGISFLALEAIGGSLAISYGFQNSFWAIVVCSVIIFFTGLPISYYSAKYNLDMDLLTRGAGFGYIGSTVTSVIYASFTFIFFALEAAIMAQALDLYFGLPLVAGYILCSIVIIPLVLFGVTAINKFQLWTQPIWLVLMVLPFVFVLRKDPTALSTWTHFAGRSPSGRGFDPILFGLACNVSFSLAVQIGEQVDYLRFMPDRKRGNRFVWWLALLLAGPGWIILGGAKQLAGAFLSSLAVRGGSGYDKAVEPIVMYLTGYSYVLSNPALILLLATAFVVVSQMKINVTNAYAGSLAWSNFFSRLSHSHPGRVVWLVFNVAIALLLMMFGVFHTLDKVLGFYSNVAIAWIGAIVADLVINKPLGWSPPYIEFKRAHLYNINPVGFGSMTVASVASVLAFAGVFGQEAQAFSSFIALGIAFVLSPAIAYLTRGKYYIARENVHFSSDKAEGVVACCICEHNYEPQDMAFCPVYDGPICSLCCTLDARCHDACKEPSAKEPAPARNFIHAFAKEQLAPRLSMRVRRFLRVFLTVAGVVAAMFWLFFMLSGVPASLRPALVGTFVKLYAGVLVLIGVGSFWLVLSWESRELIEEELDRQNVELQQEITEHKKTEEALSLAKEKADEVNRQLSVAMWQAEAMAKAAEAANRAKSQFVANMSHELRTPLNAIIGYSEMLQEDAADLEKPAFVADLQKIHQAGSHLLGLINDVLDLSKIEASKMDLYTEPFDLQALLDEVASALRPMAAKHEDTLEIERPDEPFTMHSDLTKARQILYNLLSNAVKFTRGGAIRLRMTPEERSGRPGARLDVEDQGIGMTAEQQARLFQSFTQADASTARRYGGTGLGLVLTKRYVEMLGGTIGLSSDLGKGTTFTVWLPADLAPPSSVSGGVEKSSGPGPSKDRRRLRTVPPPTKSADSRGRSTLSGSGTSTGVLVLVIDDDASVRDLLKKHIASFGYSVVAAANGDEGLHLAKRLRPSIITLDVMMPGMDGWMVLSALKADPELAATPVIVVSILEDKSAGYALGAAEYLTKPVRREELSRVLSRYRDASASRSRVLCVEDDETTRAMMETMLQKAGWDVVVAENGKVAIEKLTAMKDLPSAILVDLMMPEMDGFELVERLKANARWAAIPVIVLTAKDVTDEDRARLNAGVLRIFQKGGYGRGDLLEEIHRRIMSAALSGGAGAPPPSTRSP
jgi:signal transduction histidine kinase/CheY-like chemotaxis protein/purine-cytosine permease-like protein